jgi:heme exporter protein A
MHLQTAPAAAPALLAARGLACRRGRQLLFRDLDLALQRGNVRWLRGANGSGKTSLLRILAGLSQAAEGDVLWQGLALGQAGEAARRALIYISHANGLKDDLTLLESLAFLADLAGLDRSTDRARQALARLGLSSRGNAPVRTLSQGQRRRGALARLVLDDSPARVWLLDEPFDALDAPSSALLAELITDHSARGGAVLLTSHQAVDLPGAADIHLEAWRVQ